MNIAYIKNYLLQNEKGLQGEKTEDTRLPDDVTFRATVDM
jgi:hypothetical protein